MAFGFHNLSRSRDALGHCVTFWGYGDVVKGTTNIAGQTGGRKMRLIEADERHHLAGVPRVGATTFVGCEATRWAPHASSDALDQCAS